MIKIFHMNFDYNTQRKRMSLPEYGRNVLKMIEHIKTIKDREERNRAAATVIQIMGNLNPGLREVTDFRHKLWDHLMIIADFDLDVDSPYPAPDRRKLDAEPNKVPYNNGRIKYAHYGHIVPAMIEAATGIEDEDERDHLIALILNQMKKGYLTWNKSQVADEVIFNDLIEISGNRLKVPENFRMAEARELIPQQKGKSQSKHQGRPQGRTGKQSKKKHKNGY